MSIFDVFHSPDRVFRALVQSQFRIDSEQLIWLLLYPIVIFVMHHLLAFDEPAFSPGMVSNMIAAYVWLSNYKERDSCICYRTRTWHLVIINEQIK